MDIEEEINLIRDRVYARLAIVERLAREVMGWHLFSEDADQWLDSDSKHAAPRTWSPLLNIADAMQVLEKADGLWELSRYPEAKDDNDPNTALVTRYGCRLRFGDKLGSAVSSRSASEAIALAAYNAIDSRKIEDILDAEVVED